MPALCGVNWKKDMIEAIQATHWSLAFLSFSLVWLADCIVNDKPRPFMAAGGI